MLLFVVFFWDFLCLKTADIESNEVRLDLNEPFSVEMSFYWKIIAHIKMFGGLMSKDIFRLEADAKKKFEISFLHAIENDKDFRFFELNFQNEYNMVKGYGLAFYFPSILA